MNKSSFQTAYTVLDSGQNLPNLVSRAAALHVQSRSSLAILFFNQFNHKFNCSHSQAVNLALHKSKLDHRNKQQFPSLSLYLSPSKYARCPFAVFSSCLAPKYNASVSEHHLGSDPENYLGVCLTSSEFSLPAMDFKQIRKTLLNQTLPN